MKKLEKQPFKSFIKGLDGEESRKDSNHSKDSNDKDIKKKESLLGSMSVEQIQSLIVNVIKAQLGGGPRWTHLCTKPYTKRIYVLHMPHGYRPSKFNQFNGKDNHRQHIAHFVETWSNASMEGDRLVKQFVRSLKGNSFDWYTDLESESINSWEQMEHDFLNQFYNTQCTISIMKLISTKQWNDEPVLDYVSHWRSLSLECKDPLSEASAIKMSTQVMEWDLLYVL